MPMNKLNVLFRVSYIYSLQIVSVVPQMHKMFEIYLRNAFPLRYDFYLKNYYSSNDKIPIITEIKSPRSNIQGFIYIHSNQATNTYIKNLYCFSNDFIETNQIFYNCNFNTALNQNNFLNIHIPTMLFNIELESRVGIKVKKISKNISDINLKMQNNFTEFILSSKLKIISLSRQLLHDLTNRPESRIKHSLENNDYILAFFDRDYDKIISFLKDFILLLQQKDNKLLRNEIPIFLTNFVKNNLNIFWKNELTLSDMDFNTFKDIHLLNCFFNDLTNLFFITKDPNYKFELYDYDQNIDSLHGYSYVTVLFNFQEDIDVKNLKCLVYDKKNNELDFKLMIDSTKRKIFFMFDINYLKEFYNTQINCIVQTPKKHYQSCDIYLNDHL